jgi:para-nitrobenzyl esterase
MKRFTLLFSFLLLSLCSFGQATSGCDGKRYLQDVFTDTIMTTVKYGSNKNLITIPIDLMMNVIEPKGDVQTKRPLIIFAFGGGFVQGKRADMHSFCETFAKKGYVTATIDYRLYSIAFGFPPDSTKIMPAIVQATQDMKAAIRYFYKDAKTANKFKIDTNNIIIGGVSAGAITAMVAAQLDETDPIAPWLQPIFKEYGGIEGASGNPGNSSKVKGVMNMSGALYQKEWLDKSDVPFISYHGTIDKTVAYGYGKNVYNFYGHGSGTLYPEARKVGISSVLVSVPGGDHSDIYDPKGKFYNYFLEYMNRSFLFNKQIVCNETITSLNTAANDIDLRQVNIYPNPSSDDMNLVLGENAQGGYTVAVYDLTGREVFHSGKQNTEQFLLKKADIGTGLFITKVVFEQKQSVLIRKIIFE